MFRPSDNLECKSLKSRDLYFAYHHISSIRIVCRHSINSDSPRGSAQVCPSRVRVQPRTQKQRKKRIIVESYYVQTTISLNVFLISSNSYYTLCGGYHYHPHSTESLSNRSQSSSVHPSTWQTVTEYLLFTWPHIQHGGYSSEQERHGADILGWETSSEPARHRLTMFLPVRIHSTEKINGGRRERERRGREKSLR